MIRVANAPVISAIVSNGVFTQQARNMATLKAIQIRLKSVKNIQKITQSMKMVSAAKWVSTICHHDLYELMKTNSLKFIIVDMPVQNVT